MTAAGGMGAAGGADRRTVISVLRRLRTPEGLVAPFPLYRKLQQLGDVVPAPWGGHFVTGFDACDQVLRGKNWLVPDLAWQERQPDQERWQALATREMSMTLSRLNAPAHTCQRRSLGNLFDRTTLQEMQPVVDGYVRRLLDGLAADLRENGVADLVPLVSDRLPISVVGEWLGIPPEDRAHLVEATHRQAHSQELLPTKTELNTAAAATMELRQYFTGLVRRRRRCPGDDVLSRWIRVWDENLPEDRQAADRILYHLSMFITVAALETTSTALSTLVRHLVDDPDRWEWLRAHPEHVDDAVEETVRFDPPIQLNTRVAAEDTVLAGVPLARDTAVYVMYGAANHDPRHTPDPQTFDILRDTPHLAFGSGPHYCLGSALARQEMRSLLTGLLERFPTLHPAATPAYASRMVFRRVNSLKVTT